MIRMTEDEFRRDLSKSFDDGARAAIEAIRTMLNGLEDRLNPRPHPTAHGTTEPQEAFDGQ